MKNIQLKSSVIEKLSLIENKDILLASLLTRSLKINKIYIL